jgi:hypothetical protein
VIVLYSLSNSAGAFILWGGVCKDGITLFVSKSGSASIHFGGEGCLLNIFYCFSNSAGVFIHLWGRGW